MTKRPATQNPEPSAMTLREHISDRGTMAATKMDLLWRLIGESAANEYAVHHSLWRLLSERRGLGLPWFEAEKLDHLAELLRRFAHQASRPEAGGVDGPEAAAALFRHLALDHEELWIACLNVKNIPLAVLRVGIGGPNSVVAFPAHVYREALAWNASGILVAHNHPSGDPTPSMADRDFTKRLEQGAELIGIPVVDCLVLGSEGRVYSFARKGEVRLP